MRLKAKKIQLKCKWSTYSLFQE